MKNSFLRSAILTAFISFPLIAPAQTWGGSTTTTGDAYRNGNVGIGNTTTPQAWLHVSMSAGIPMRLERTGGGNQNNYLDVGFTSNPAAGVTVGAGSVFFKLNNPYGVSDMVFLHTSTSAGMIIKSSGKIGMGTVNPSQGLHVHNGAIKLSGAVSGYGGPMILFGSANTDGSGIEQWGLEYVPSANSPRPGLNFWKPFGSPNSGNYYLYLRDNGYVGVNTDNPTARFTVNGNVLIGDPATVTIPNANYKLFVETGILTEKVKVAVKNTANWSDFVFEPGYELRPLVEVEQYIADHKHLPDIPSADEVVKDGVDLGEMDARLLQKVEELTLYIIALERRIKELEGGQK